MNTLALQMYAETHHATAVKQWDAAFYEALLSETGGNEYFAEQLLDKVLAVH